jgi:putative ABC transport system permease protein
MAAVSNGHSFTLTGEGEPTSVDGDRVTADYFALVGVTPALGRAFLPSEGQAGNDHVAILSDELWRERFGADPNVIGKVIKLDLEPYTIVGVMPPGRAIPMPWVIPRLWTPLTFAADDLSPSKRANRWLDMVLARLKPGVKPSQAQAEMDSIAKRLAAAYPETNKDYGGATVTTLQEYLIRKPQIRTALLILMFMVAFVLLIACANIAGLLLARGSGRAHEMAVRSAVGASRKRLILQMLIESLLIGIAGGAAGLILSIWGIDLLRAGFNFNQLGRQMAIFFHLDQKTLLFTAAVTLLTTILAGLAPAIRTSRINPGDALTEGGRGGSGSLARSRLRGVLVTGEIGLALALLAATGVFAREIRWELSQPAGFDPQHLLLAGISLKSRRYQKSDAQITFFQQTTEKLGSLPGVLSASATTGTPLSGDWSTAFSIVGQPPASKSQRPSAQDFIVGPGYFRTMRIPLLKGRDFSDDDNLHSPAVAIINEALAHTFFPNGNALGQMVEVDNTQHKPAQIVGIAGNVLPFYGEPAPRPQIYESYLQFPVPNITLVLRSRTAPTALASMLRQSVWWVDKNQPIGRIETMEDVAAESTGGDKLMVALMGIFAALALVLAAVGIYGIVAHTIGQRTREIGIRMALGAEKKDVLRLVLRQEGYLTGIGCAVGLALALPLPRLFTGMFEGFPSQGPLVAITATSLIAVVSLLATYIPARRATRVDPMVSLRYE